MCNCTKLGGKFSKVQQKPKVQLEKRTLAFDKLSSSALVSMMATCRPSWTANLDAKGVYYEEGLGEDVDWLLDQHN